MESHEEWRDLKEEEIKIRRGDRSENVDHNSNCHLFTSLNCSKSYSNYQKKNSKCRNDEWFYLLRNIFIKPNLEISLFWYENDPKNFAYYFDGILKLNC